MLDRPTEDPAHDIRPGRLEEPSTIYYRTRTDMLAANSHGYGEEKCRMAG